jgi:luciferase-like monooxygenase
MKTRSELNQELRERILALPGVTERPKAGIHEDAFFVGKTMFMHIHGHGHCDIRLAKVDQERVLAKGRARPHRWAPEAGYITFMVNAESDLEPAMALIRTSHDHFAGVQSLLASTERSTHP